MFRLVLSLFFWVAIARWGYAEIELYSPSSIPKIDRFLEAITPATHDKWPEIQIVRTDEGMTFIVEEREQVRASSSNTQSVCANTSEMTFSNFLSQLR